jgi:hypothetical protein
MGAVNRPEPVLRTGRAFFEPKILAEDLGRYKCCVSKAITESWLVGRRDGLDASGLTAAFRALALAHLECAARRDVREPANLSR